jgi:uncharacterized protein YbjT (DUF2867 family)
MRQRLYLDNRQGDDGAVLVRTEGKIMYVLLGANGNITSKAVRILLSQGKRARVVGRGAQRLQSLRQAGAELAVGDITDVQFLTSAMRGAEGV